MTPDINVSLPFGLFGRIWTAIRQNPCTIEVIEHDFPERGQWVRIRNDSHFPVQLFGVSFRWKFEGKQGFTDFHMPMVWMLSNHTNKPLAPFHSFEHPIDAHELGKPVAMCEVSVRHNRSRFEEKKRFKIKIKTYNPADF